MAEAKFERPELTPEQINEIRRRAETPVDSHARARQVIARREQRPEDWARAILTRFGFDPRRTVTELEGVDAGDAPDIADEAEVHGLRHVPLDRWTPGDTHLMLTYGHGTDHGIWLALDCLEADPMIEAEHYPGDLLIQAAKIIAEEEPRPFPSREKAQAMIRSVLAEAERKIWSDFEERAGKKLALHEDVVASERLRLEEGRLPDEPEAFRETVAGLDVLAEAREWIAPPELLMTAGAEMIYARYRPRRGLEIVPKPEFDDPAVREHLERPDTFYFRRATRFEIVDAGPCGVRLRHFSESAIENWHGRAFPSIEDAVAFAREIYGIGGAAWTAA